MKNFKTGHFKREKLKGWLWKVCPSDAVASVQDIDLEQLAKDGKKLMLLDVDNTLLPWGSHTVPDTAHKWLAEVREHGISLCIISNTRRVARLQRVSEALGVPYLRGKFKPSRTMYRMAMEMFRVTPEETVMVGDQLFTDVLGANRSGVDAIWVRQVAKREFAGTKISRLGERIVRRRLYRQLEEN